MKTTTCKTYSVKIWMAGDIDRARDICRQFCRYNPLCVTVSACDYIYPYGEESGFVVGLINYPKFPSTMHELTTLAEYLAECLMDGLCQKAYTIQSDNGTQWFSKEDEIETANRRRA